MLTIQLCFLSHWDSRCHKKITSIKFLLLHLSISHHLCSMYFPLLLWNKQTMLLARATTSILCALIPSLFSYTGSFSSAHQHTLTSIILNYNKASIDSTFPSNCCSIPPSFSFFKRSVCTLFLIFSSQYLMILPTLIRPFLLAPYLNSYEVFLCLFLSHPWILWPSNSIWHRWSLILSWKHFLH